MLEDNYSETVSLLVTEIKFKELLTLKYSCLD